MCFLKEWFSEFSIFTLPVFVSKFVYMQSHAGHYIIPPPEGVGIYSIDVVRPSVCSPVCLCNSFLSATPPKLLKRLISNFVDIYIRRCRCFNTWIVSHNFVSATPSNFFKEFSSNYVDIFIGWYRSACAFFFAELCIFFIVWEFRSYFTICLYIYIYIYRLYILLFMQLIDVHVCF